MGVLLIFFSNDAILKRGYLTVLAPADTAFLFAAAKQKTHFFINLTNGHRELNTLPHDKCFLVFTLTSFQCEISSALLTAETAMKSIYLDTSIIEMKWRQNQEGAN